MPPKVKPVPKTKFITNIKINNDLITFDLNNSSTKIKTALANGIRRSIISMIYTYAIDSGSVNFIENSSMLNSEFLRHRLTLLPISSDIPDFDYESLVIECKKENMEEDIQSIYVSDFVCLVNDKQIDTSIVFPQPATLFGKLKTNQKVSFQGKVVKNCAEKGGAFFSPVSSCVFTFQQDPVAIEQMKATMTPEESRSFMLQDVERVYKKNEDKHPSTYVFSIESIGFYGNPLKIVLLGLHSLIDRFTLITLECKNPKKSKKISISSLENGFTSIFIDDENETVGNILSTYLAYTENVFYCGYIIEHPLNKNILLKIKLKEGGANANSEENVLSTIIKSMDEVVGYLRQMVDDCA